MYVYICIVSMLPFKRKTKAEAIFLNPFIVCSLCKRKFVVCPVVNEQTNKSYPFANGLNGLAHLGGGGGFKKKKKNTT